MESLGTSPKRNDGGDGRPWGVAAQSWATAPATLTEKRAMKKEEEEDSEKTIQSSKSTVKSSYLQNTFTKQKQISNLSTARNKSLGNLQQKWQGYAQSHVPDRYLPPRRVARIWKRGGGYFERVRSVQTTLTRIFIDLESISDGLSETWGEMSRKARKFEGFFRPKLGDLQNK